MFSRLFKKEKRNEWVKIDNRGGRYITPEDFRKAMQTPELQKLIKEIAKIKVYPHGKPKHIHIHIHKED